MKSILIVLPVSLWLIWQTNLNAQSLTFELDGMAGPGVSAANEPGEVVDGGSGDSGPGGIILDLATNELSVDVEWGSGNGYIDLSSDVDFMNIHGPTSVQAPDSFTDSSSLFFGLNGFDASAVSGGYVDTVFIEDVKGLLEGRYYIHLHTFVNGGGEARGYFIPEVVLGDVSGDGLINLIDVAPFVNALADGQFIPEADLNRDGVVNLLDVGPFIELLAG